jgi:hypothetical protein
MGVTLRVKLSGYLSTALVAAVTGVWGKRGQCGAHAAGGGELRTPVCSFLPA